MMRVAVTVCAVPLLLVVLIGAAFASGTDQAQSAVNASALPPLAQQLLPELSARLADTCPDLPVVWVIAEAQAESSWNPTAMSSAGAAGLLQMMPGTWAAAGGPGPTWSLASPPAADHPVFDPATHLAIATGWMCTNLHLVTAHLAATGKPIDPLDAVAVCHIAGCSRVTGSATGIPTPGEAGCGSGCVDQITHYLAAIHHWVVAYSAAVPIAAGPSGGDGSSPQPYPGGSTGCQLADPTGTGGCVTGATAWLLAQVSAHAHQGPVACWSARAPHPSGDHPLGRACDYTFGRLGAYPGPADVAAGWALAGWLQTYARPLHVAYVIWQGRIWSLARNAEGWRPYTGGGVYDPTGPTGGHYDHVHVSLDE